MRNLTITRATASGQPTTLTFDAVRSSQVRLDMTSAAPGVGEGFLQIVSLEVLSGGTAVTSAQGLRWPGLAGARPPAGRGPAGQSGPWRRARCGVT